MNDKPKAKRGFAAMSPEKQRELASRGGKAVPAAKRSFSRDSKLASAAGSLGGRAVAPENRSFSQDKKLASRAGFKGATNRPKIGG